MSDSNRDDLILNQLLEIQKGQGRLEGKIDGVNDHVKAVSGKADTIRGELKAHGESEDPHPRAERRAGASWAQWLAIVIAGAALLVPMAGRLIGK